MDEKYDSLKSPGSKRHQERVRYKAMAGLVPAEALSPEEFAEILAAHGEFIASGGGGGRWQTYATDGPGVGVVFGVYVGSERAGLPGAQAELQHSRLEGLDLRGVQLPYANLCGVRCRSQDLRGANLSGSLATDADFSDANLEGADLSRADLSRSDLVRCNLRDTDLTHADFEHADLTGADLRGAKLEGAHFAGAQMEQVLR